MSQLLARLQQMNIEDRERWLRFGLTDFAKPARLAHYRAFLTAPYFLAAKIEHRAVKTAALLRDFERYLELQPGDAEVEALYRLIAQSAALLDQGVTLSEIANSLYSRLRHRSEFRQLVRQWSRELRRPYLTAAQLLPDHEHPALLYTFREHQEAVKACALSRDGELIASVSARRFYRWRRNGQEAPWERPRVLTEDESFLPVCALSADGAVVALALYRRLSGAWIEVWQQRQPLAPTWSTALPPGWALKHLLLSADGQTLVIAVEHSNVDSGGAPTHCFIVQQLGGNHSAVFPGVEGWLFGCALSADGALLASAAQGNLYLWETATGHLRRTFSHPGTRQSFCALSPDGRLLVSAGGSSSSAGGKSVLEGSVKANGKRDFSLSLWDVEGGRLQGRLLGHQAPVNACAISADKRLLVSAAADNRLILWDTFSGQPLITLRGHRATHRGVSNLEGCAISAGGNLVVSASSDGTVKVWDTSPYAATRQGSAATRRSDRTIGKLVVARHFAADCAMDAAGRFVVSVHQNELLLWEVQSGRRRLRLTGHDQQINGCAISADGSLIVSAGDDKTLKRWHIEPSAPTRGLQRVEAVATFSGHQDGPLQSVPGLFGQLFQPQGRPSYRGVVRRCAISPDRRWLVSAAQDRSLIVWDLSSGAIRHRLHGHSEGVSDCAISPDARLLVSASDDQSLKLWSAADGRELRTLHGHRGAVVACAIAPDSSAILSAGADGSIRVWDVAGSRAPLIIADAHLGRVNDCQFSHTGAWLLSCGADGALKIWDRESQKLITSIRVAGALHACAWSPDAQRIVAAGAQGVYFFTLLL